MNQKQIDNIIIEEMISKIKNKSIEELTTILKLSSVDFRPEARLIVSACRKVLIGRIGEEETMLLMQEVEKEI